MTGTAIVATGARPKGRHDVDLPLDLEILNEQFMAVGLWLMNWEIPHRARVATLPGRRIIRVSFPDKRLAYAFCREFGGELAIQAERLRTVAV
jgi:hypothetical protein